MIGISESGLTDATHERLRDLRVYALELRVEEDLALRNIGLNNLVCYVDEVLILSLVASDSGN